MVKTNFTTQIFTMKHSLTHSTVSDRSVCFQACVVSIKPLLNVT